jgi:hypothetical protein
MQKRKKVNWSIKPPLMNESIIKITTEMIAAFSTPVIALLAVFYTRSQARTDEARRQQELFEMRFKFYKMIRNGYLHHATTGEPMDPTTFMDYCDEAKFLFGRDIVDHLIKLHEHKVSEQARLGGYIDDWFVSPFEKYLMLR